MFPDFDSEIDFALQDNHGEIRWKKGSFHPVYGRGKYIEGNYDLIMEEGNRTQYMSESKLSVLNLVNYLPFSLI